MKTLLGHPLRVIIEIVSQLEGPYVAKPCPCGHRFCKQWHVHPIAAFQGVSFTEEQAKLVAGVLNLHKEAQKDPD